MKTFKLEIKTPEKLVFSGPVTKLTAIAEDGELGILPDHAALATLLAKAPLRYTLESGKEVAVDGGEGFLIVDNNRAAALLKG